MSESPSPSPSRAVFVSYAREDTPAAQRIAEALRSHGVEVWFDREELRGGDVWDARIRRQIGDCTLFLPVISRQTQERNKGYFRLEWKLAVEQTHLMAEGVPFLAPVVIDDTAESSAIVPPEFLKVQWTRLAGALPTTQFVEQIKRLFKAPRNATPGTRAAGATPAPPPGGKPDSGMADGKHSIVVLPFQNLSADPDNEYFSDGLTDELITDLSQIRTLRVISRNSSMQLKGTARNLKALTAELGVRHVLSGSVRKSGNAVRITAQLVDPVRDEHLWAEKYSGSIEDIFNIQEQISRRIVDALKMQLSPAEEHKLAERPINNVAALECYHRAMQEIYKFTAEGLDRALELIAMAHDIVGDNELLHAARGTVCWQYVNTTIRRDDGYIEQAEQCARQVFALNPESAVGHALLGLVRQAQGRPAEAIRSLLQSWQVDPSISHVADELGRVYMMVGREGDAVIRYQRALDIDPLSPIHQVGLFCAKMLAGDGEAMRRDAPRLLRAVPEFSILRVLLALALVQAQRLDEARTLVEAAPGEKIPTIAGRLCLWLNLALNARVAEAADCVGEDLLQRAGKVEFWSWVVAECYAYIGQDELALDWLDNALRRGFSVYPYLAEHSPIFRRLHGHARFPELLGRYKTTWELMQRVE